MISRIYDTFVHLARLRAFARMSRSRTARLILIRGTDVALFALAGLSAFLLRFEFIIPASQASHVALSIASWLLLKPLIYFAFGLWNGGWSFVSLYDARRLLFANAAASLVSGLLITSVAVGFPRSVFVLDMLLCYTFGLGARGAVRMNLELARTGLSRNRKRTLIYGAGNAGMMVLREVRLNPHMEYDVCGFIDDDRTKTGLRIQGSKVLGPGTTLADIAARHGVHEILIAIPSATGPQMTKILSYCAAAKLRFQTIPALAEVIGGRGLAAQIRDVAVEDLLARMPVRLDEGRIRGKLEGEVVLVTGGAGSIGSELCRQIARFGPASIIAFEIAETPLFHLEAEMQKVFPSIGFEPVIGSVRDRARLSQVLARFRPAVVFHAAAYKHVPMMEGHLFEAVANNILGTYNVAALAADSGVRDFVMISSDKAVRPTSVMGLSKRVAELVVSSLPDERTKYVSVRFGNVLGSNGSVIPIFKKQIAAGGPVTVTHPEMRRYFMTIPEAAQLVLQAYAIGRGGEIFMLDMGEPVRILDLARNLILLSGLRPDEDIRIEFTGVRAGEKLYEELSTNDEETVATPYKKIRIFNGNRGHVPDVTACIEELGRMCVARDYRLLIRLKELVPEYNPSTRALTMLISDPPVQIATHNGSLTRARAAGAEPLREMGTIG